MKYSDLRNIKSLSKSRQERRVAEVRKQKRCLFGMALACVLLFLLIILGAFKWSAEITFATPAGAQQEKAYKSVRIEQDDCLWSIATREMGEEWDDIRVYIQEVKEINQLTSDRINCGAYLILPYFTSTGEEPSL